MAEQFDVVIVGGGQAGRGSTAGTPCICSRPRPTGHSPSMPDTPDGSYPTRDEALDYLRRYARYAPPIPRSRKSHEKHVSSLFSTHGGTMTTRLPAALLSACLIMVSTTAYADPPWARGDHDHGGHDHHGEGHGYGHMKHWRKGDYYSGPREQRWMVGDWHRYHGLWAPPSGYYWMQSGGQYLLMAAATGLIAGVVAATVGAVPSAPVGPGYPVAPGYPMAPAYPPPPY